MQVQIPMGIFENPGIESFSDMENFLNSKAKKNIEEGSNPPLFFGKAEDGTILVVNLSEFWKMGGDFRPFVKSFLRELVKERKVGICALILETWKIELADNDPDVEKYKSGELPVREHPNRKEILSFVIQRPGHYKVVLHDIVVVDGKRTIGKRIDLGPDKAESQWFLWEDQLMQ